jgi:hypothetical protein
VKTAPQFGWLDPVPAGNVVEVWDFFERGDGASEGIEALA